MEILLFYIYFIDYAITVVPFSSLYSPLPCTPSPSGIPAPSPPLVHVYGHTYKFFGFYISCTILNLPLSFLYLPFMLLIPCTFSPLLPSPSPLITLHVISIFVILSCSSCLLSLVLLALVLVLFF